jgi:hypothetical protein
MSIGDWIRKLRGQPTSGEMVQRLENAAKPLGADPNSWRDPAAAIEHAGKASNSDHLAALAEAIASERDLNGEARNLREAPKEGILSGVPGGKKKAHSWDRPR